MEISVAKYCVLIVFLFFLIACSTKKDTFSSRSYHAVTTKFNVLYNGNVALEKGIKNLKDQYKDNFWEILPVERMNVKKEITIYADTIENRDFIKAEEKAIKAIQKHSMNIEGNEKNPQMDKAYLLLGKARYYEQRFIPALEAFNYILYKHSNSNKIYEAKIWREKTNVRMDYDELAIKNLKILLKNVRFKDQIIADANAILTQAYINTGQKDSAVFVLKNAIKLTKSNEERARYRFILGQLYEEINEKDSAYISYQSVIDMNRKSPRSYVIRAHAKQAQYFDFEKGDKEAFIKKYDILLKDRENRLYLDMLNHQMGLFYQKSANDSLAVLFYNKSLRFPSEDDYLMASSYRNLAKINFEKTNYPFTAQYYDSTMIKMNSKTREYRDIKKKREDLVDVIKYESIAKVNDSILDILALSQTDRVRFFEKHIAAIKQKEEIKSDGKKTVSKVKNFVPSFVGNVSSGIFYFYNSTTVAYGKNEFKKKWGERTLINNWRGLKTQSLLDAQDESAIKVEEDNIPSVEDRQVIAKYTAGYYLDQLPKTSKKIDSITRERNLAYYRLGLIYKDKFKKYDLATAKLEKLLTYNLEERLIPPTTYNLYKIYEITDENKAEIFKRRILNKYPASEYAQILKNPDGDIITSSNDAELMYAKLYKEFEKGEYKDVLKNIDSLIVKFSADDIVSKYELLKANAIGRLKGVEEYEKALRHVVLNYPNNEEGKQADSILKNDITQLKSLKFDNSYIISWKVLFKVGMSEKDKIKHIEEQLNRFIVDRRYYRIKMSLDNYTSDEKFIVIHGFSIEEEANGFVSSLLRENKKYKMTGPFYVISNDNYKIVQIKKNFTQYLEFKNK